MDHVLPEGVPLRQYVLTLPFELRARIAYDRELMGGVGHLRRHGARPLGSLSNTEFGDLMQAVRIRVLGCLARQGVIESSAEAEMFDV